MQSKKGIPAHLRLALGAALCASSLANAQVPSQLPLVTPSALPPNIVLTIDDSANMQRAYAPEYAPADLAALAATRRFKSAKFNPLYYNPNVRYEIPPGAVNNPQTAFGAALANGYRAALGSIDLGSQYRPTLTYDPASTFNGVGHVLAPHVSADHAADLAVIGASDANAPGPAYYYVYDASLAACIASGIGIANDDCYRPVRVSISSGPATTDINGDGAVNASDADERQNFANWYSYFRTRNLAMVTAAWRAVSDAALAGSGVRVAWQGTNNSCTSLSAVNAAACAGLDAGGNPVPSNLTWNFLRTFDAGQETSFRAWLRKLPAGGNGAALRTAVSRAGEYYRGSSSAGNNPYLKDPQSALNARLGDGSANVEYACRPNFHLLMTGSTTGDASPGAYCQGSACGNQDGAARALPAPTDAQSIFAGITSYAPAGPYRDNNSDSLADTAFYYWRTDLRPDLNNILLPFVPDRSAVDATGQFFAPRNDPASWQHMVNFVVGIGLSRTLTGAPAWDPNNPFASLSSTTAWPATGSAQGDAYDLWHAAIDSRGELFDATDSADIAGALRSTLGRAIDRANVGAAIATNSSRLTTESVLYQASFSSADWSGSVRAIDVNRDGSLGVDLWGAALASAGSRNIWTSTGNTAPVAFNAAALLGAGLQAPFGATAAAATNMINYLRGDGANEGGGAGQLRPRAIKLGDIVNSDLIYAADETFNYSGLPEAIDSSTIPATNVYDSFTLGKKCNTANGPCAGKASRMIYVGANDGMLHGFNADTGAEVFAYVPRAVLLNNGSTSSSSPLVQLSNNGNSNPSYLANHRYFVDGSPWVGDAYLDSTRKWRTVLVGVTGAGGRGAFALDVTVNPAAARDWSSTLADFDSRNVLWDFDGVGDNDLGYTLGQPVVGRLADGDFYAFYGNGSASANGCPTLYMVRLRDGFVRKIKVNPAGGAVDSSTTCAANGLGRPSLFDTAVLDGTAGDRITEYVYAGDLKGNVWRFDLRNLLGPSGSSPQLLASALGVRIFNKAVDGNGQPITGGIEIGKGPNLYGNCNNTNNPVATAMLYFGTGSFFLDADKTSTATQSFFGLIDDFLPQNGPYTVSDLRQRFINATTRVFVTSANGNTADNTALTVCGKNPDRGFYMDLPGGASGPRERVVSMPLILPKRMLFASLIPNSDPCTGGGTSVIQALDPINGFSVRDNAGNISSIFLQGGGDAVTAISGFIKNLIALDSGGKVYLYYGTSTGQVQKVETRPLTESGVSGRGRTSWREITTQR